MIYLLLGGLIAWICNSTEKNLRQRQRCREAKEKLFTDDKPKYWT